jgi:poly(3-hydroxybutyrate) depolymerase
MPTATRRPQGKPLFTILNCADRYISTMNRCRPARIGLSFLTLICCGSIHAAQTVNLPSWVCTHPDAIFVSEFDTAEVPVPRDPTQGSGGTTGTTTHTAHIAGLGTGVQKYYLYVPTSYAPSQTYPFVLALHGTAPYASRSGYASDVLTAWSTVAANGQFIVAAPVADEEVSVDGQAGATWSVPPDSPSDYDLFAAVLADVESAYNIDRTRIYVWGFSSGGSVAYDLALNDYSTTFDASTLAAYSVSAGALGGLACSYSPNTCPALLQSQSRKVPVDIHVGTADDPGYSYAEVDHADFVSHGWADGSTVFFNTFAGGHTYTTSDLQLAWTHMCPSAVTP